MVCIYNIGIGVGGVCVVWFDVVGDGYIGSKDIFDDCLYVCVKVVWGVYFKNN